MFPKTAGCKQYEAAAVYTLLLLVVNGDFICVNTLLVQTRQHRLQNMPSMSSMLINNVVKIKFKVLPVVNLAPGIMANKGVAI